MSFPKINYNKYESYIRVAHNDDKSDAEDFPTPSAIGRGLRDVDLDAYTDLQGYTQRNRVRNDVEQITLSYNVLSPEDESYILNRIEPEWIWVELTNKKTGGKSWHYMYASDKEWDVHRVQYDPVNHEWYEQDTAFEFTLTKK